MLGKSIKVTADHDWSTAWIGQVHLDRYQGEHAFRSSKAPNLIGARPVLLWTDSKNRCQLRICVVSMTYLRRIEQPTHS